MKYDEMNSPGLKSIEKESRYWPGPVTARSVYTRAFPASGTGPRWGAYYWNGLIFSSELDRGMDILELTPSAQPSANEIAAAKLVQFNDYNPQSQPKMTWPPAFVVVRSYLDQLVRNGGLAPEKAASRGSVAVTRRPAHERQGAP